MLCPTCPKRSPPVIDDGRPCRWAEPTGAKWSPRKNALCHTYRCHLPAARHYPGPAFVASGNARVATHDDTLIGTPLPDAPYIAVRSCYCNAKGCAFYEVSES